ncbi:MAG: hypothetical protein ACQETI_00150 [Halobacteriota archaeon]
MVVIVRGSVPANEFALQHVSNALLETEFDVERIVESGDDAIMPLVWCGTGTPIH